MTSMTASDQNPSPSPAFARLLPPIADIASRGIIMSAQPGDCDRRPRTPAPRLLRPRCAPRARALARHKKPPHAGSPRIAPCCAPKAGGGPGAVASSGGLRRIQRLDLLNMSAPAKADIRALGRRGGFDPYETRALSFCPARPNDVENDFATWRAQSMKRWTTGDCVRFFSVTRTAGQGSRDNTIGSTAML
jgi:hypothetical protein